MKRLSLTLILCGLLSVATVYAEKPVTIKASANYITKSLPNAGNFNAISNAGSVDIDFIQSSDGTTTLSLYGSDNILGFVKTEIKDGTLFVRFETPRNTVITGERRLKLIVTNPTLTKIDMSGSGDIELKGMINAETLGFNVTGSGDIDCANITCTNMNIQLSGSGDIDCGNINCTNLTVSSTGSGDIEIDAVEGTITNIELKGSGDLECDKLICGEVAVTTFSSGDIEIDNVISTDFIAMAKGSGSIKLTGEAINVEYLTGGSGGISALNLKAEKVGAHAAGSGSISCYASKSIDAEATGSGTVTYSGNPPTTKTKGKVNAK